GSAPGSRALPGRLERPHLHGFAALGTRGLKRGPAVRSQCGSADPDMGDRLTQGGVAGPDGNGAPRAGPGTYPDGAGAPRRGEVERVVADQHRRSRDLEADLACHVGALRAVPIDRAELQPG